MKKVILASLFAGFALSGVTLAQTTVVVPGEVKTYVLEQSAPSTVYQGEVLVGTRLPDTIEVYTIPDQPEYGYVVLNDRRVLIDPQTREVIEVW